MPTLHTERSVSPASRAPAPNISTSDAATGSFDLSSLTLTLRWDGITIAAASTISGSRREERPSPADGLGEHGARAGPSPGAEPLGIGLRDGRERDDVQAAAADPLHEPRDHQHGGENSQILGANGIPALDL